MRFKQSPPTSWDIRVIDPNTLSDEQAEYYYAKARRVVLDEPTYPRGSMGRLAIAAAYIRSQQRQLGKLIVKPELDF